MPNWCNNRVTISAGTVEEEEQLAEIVEIFKKDNPFQVLYPMPDFDKIPNLASEEMVAWLTVSDDAMNEKPLRLFLR